MRRFAAIVAVLLLCWGSIALASDVATVSLGTGRSMLVEYDLDSKPLRKYTGLKKPVDITPLADGTLLLVDEEAHEVMVFDTAGTVRWRERIGDGPLRARPRPGGGFLVTSGEEVIALRSDRSVEWRLPVKGIKAAVPLANENILTATNDVQGWLTEMTPSGAVRRRSKPRGWYDASGAWTDEQADHYFRSIWSIDAGPDGTIFTSNFDGGGLRLLSPQFENLHIFPVLGHVSDTRIGPAGELVAVAPEDFLVWLTLPNDSPRSFRTDLRPISANFSLRKTVLVGMYWEPEKSALNASAARLQPQPSVPWRQRALPFPLFGAMTALVSALILRWPQLSQRRLSGGSGLDVVGRMASAGASAAQEEARWTTARRVLLVVCTLTMTGAATLAWQATEGIQSHGLSKDVWRFVTGCIVAGIALRLLNTLAGCAGTLSSFMPSQWQVPVRTRQAPTVTLGTLSIGSLGVCLFMLKAFPEEQAIAIALWLTAQIWLVAAAVPAVVPDVTERDAEWRYWSLLGLLLLAATVMRFWQIGYYPDVIHHDHSQYGAAALHTLDGDWKPFFIMDPYTSETMARVWLVPCIAFLKLVGHHHWVLRLTGAISGVLVVWATYLLGTSLFNRRVGLIAAVLVTVNNGLLLYSRMPYVMDSAWPLVLAVHCAVVALKRGCRLHWTLAGLLSGWAMLTVRQFTMYPFIGGAMLLCLACLYPRQLWRQRSGLLWFAWALAAAYGPMLPHMLGDAVLKTQARGVVVFLNPDGSLRWDGALWANQLLRSFGSIIYYTDSSPWGVATGKPICLRYESCLFGIGLVYLFTSRRTPAMIVLVLWMVVSISLGCAALPAPPTLYHFLVAIVPIMVTNAVAVDRILALTDRWRPMWRAVPVMATVTLLAAISASQIDAFWQAVRRPGSGGGGQTVYRAGDPMMLAARFISEHPEYRYYVVRGRLEGSATSPVLMFFAAHTDISDVTTDLAEALPVPPVEPAVGAAFIVLSSRSAQREAISAVYPGATTTELRYLNGSVWVYQVPASEIRKVYEASPPITGGQTTASS